MIANPDQQISFMCFRAQRGTLVDRCCTTRNPGNQMFQDCKLEEPYC